MVFLNLNLSRKGNPKMETKTYLLKHEYDQDKKEMISKPCRINMRWKIYDTFACLEIIGVEHQEETIKHQLICHKDQTIKILNSLNEQIEHEADLEPCTKDRFYFNESVGIQWGLHGQLDLEDAIASKKEGS